MPFWREIRGQLNFGYSEFSIIIYAADFQFLNVSIELVQGLYNAWWRRSRIYLWEDLDEIRYFRRRYISGVGYIGIFTRWT